MKYEHVIVLTERMILDEKLHIQMYSTMQRPELGHEALYDDDVIVMMMMMMMMMMIYSSVPEYFC
jgi:hypothetical protein